MTALSNSRSDSTRRRDWKAIRTLLPYLWEFRLRALLALGCLVLAKVANVMIPLMLKGIVDGLDATRNPEIVLPVAFLLAYGAMRLTASLFGELRDAIFAKVTQRAIRRVAFAASHGERTRGLVVPGRRRSFWIPVVRNAPEGI